MSENAIPWTVRFAAAQVDAKGWTSVPSWLAMAVQMHRNGFGCTSRRIYV